MFPDLPNQRRILLVHSLQDELGVPVVEGNAFRSQSLIVLASHTAFSEVPGSLLPFPELLPLALILTELVPLTVDLVPMYLRLSALGALQVFLDRDPLCRLRSLAF